MFYSTGKSKFIVLYRKKTAHTALPVAVHLKEGNSDALSTLQLSDMFSVQHEFSHFEKNQLLGNFFTPTHLIRYLPVLFIYLSLFAFCLKLVGRSDVCSSCQFLHICPFCCVSNDLI